MLGNTGTEMPAATVRPAELTDVDGLISLLSQLGYPEAIDGLLNRLEMMLADPRAEVLVAEHAGALLGLATIFFVPVAHEISPWCRITALVVDEHHRGRGATARRCRRGSRSQGGMQPHRGDNRCSPNRGPELLRRARL